MDNGSNHATLRLSQRKQLLRECKDSVLVYLTTQFNEFFSQVEPALMDFSDKAETNRAQTRFFDAVKQIHAAREPVERRFREVIEQGYQDFENGLSIKYPPSLIEAHDPDHMAVVDNDSLEEHLAIQKMIAKADNESYQQLYALGQRLALLRGGKKLEIDDIPACPAHTALAFHTAAELFQLEQDLLLIVYFLFGKFVLEDASSIYLNLNEHLIEAGVFPNLKLEAIKSKNSGRAAKAKSHHYPTEAEPAGSSEPRFAQPPMSHPRSDDDWTSGSFENFNNFTPERRKGVALGEELFQSIHDLLTRQRAQNPDYQDHPEYTEDGDLSQLRSKPDLLHAIDQLTPADSSTLIPMEDEESLPGTVDLDTDLIHKVRDTLASERKKLYQQLDKNTIPAADLDTIELVGMLFEEVLNEEALANITKALISHLHTPYLKVAILDHLFLTDNAHVARQLLDLLVSAGRQWVDEEDLRRGIYYPMQQVVNRVLSQFRDEKDLELFKGCHAELSEQVEELENRARILEERNQEAARGKERLENARHQAKQILDNRCNGQTLHPIIHRFLYHAWQDRMILMLLRDPDAIASEEWLSVVQVVDDVIKLAQVIEQPELKEWLKRTLPGLKLHIKIGLDTLGTYNGADSTALFKLITALLKKEDTTGLAPEGKETEVAIVPEQIKPIEAREKSEPVAEAAVATKPELAKDAALDELARIQFGSWMELPGEDDSTRRLKLSWFSPITHKYMFVDRFGIQALVIPAETLAGLLRDGSARLLEQNNKPFVQRALSTIHSLLEKTLGLKSTKSTGKFA